MSKQIVVLEVLPGEPQQIVRFAMWVPIPGSYQALYANPTAVSAYKGVSPPELSQIQSGQVAEVVSQTMIQPGWSIADIKAELIRNYSLQTTVFSATTAQYLRYGVSWDGMTWSA